ncbi:MAG: sodium-dependent transporter [Spirochaetaceae bacterium]
MKAPREQWTSRVAFILAAAGSAVGLGNIWRFPYLAGTNGGAAFLIIYLVLIVLIGYPLIVTEVTLGQKSHKNAIGTFKALAADTPWWVVGALGVLAGFVILSFYSVVGGWSVAYFFKAITGSLTTGTEFGAVFGELSSSAGEPLLWHAVFMLLTIGIIATGVVKGIDRAVRVLMPALFVLLLILVLRSITLPGAGEGLAFYLKPDFSNFTANSLLDAVGQAFFSLSLGMGCMITYGSYMRDSDTVGDNAGWVVGLDTLIAVLAGFAIFPAVFALGGDPSSGPGLTFITLPGVFAEMPGGVIFAVLFFLLLTVAALTSAISLLEVVVAWLVDEHEWDRKKASILIGLLIFLLGVPASLSLGAVDITVGGMAFFDFLDFLQGSILLPLGGILTAIFAGYVWTAKRTREQANANPGKIKIGVWYDFLIKYLVPIAIAIVMITGLISKFSG